MDIKQTILQASAAYLAAAKINDEEQKKLLVNFAGYLSDNLSNFTAKDKQEEEVTFFDNVGKGVKPLADDATEFVSSAFKNKGGKPLVYKVPSARDDISMNRFIAFQQMSFEIMTGQDADQLLKNLLETSGAMQGMVKNATAGTSPVTNAHVLEWADKVYNTAVTVGNLIGVRDKERETMQALRVKLLKACALICLLHDPDTGAIMEDATVYNDSENEAKVKDWITTGYGIRFFLILFQRFSQLFRSSLQLLTQKYSKIAE